MTPSDTSDTVRMDPNETITREALQAAGIAYHTLAAGLRRAGIDTWDELTRAGRGLVLSLPGVGPDTVAKIERFLGHPLADDDSGWTEVDRARRERRNDEYNAWLEGAGPKPGWSRLDP